MRTVALRLQGAQYIAVAVIGAGLSVAAAAITVSDASGDSWLAAAGRASMVGVPVAVGLYAWRNRPEGRFGPLLLGAGFIWFLSTLAESPDSLPYSIGRASGW